jgi:predicted N-formylglutamate amidohydrolase
LISGQATQALLASEDPPPVGIVNAKGGSPFLLLGDHSGTAIPAGLGTLGLGPVDLGRHIAVDIGVRGLGEAVATLLDAPFLHQIYSRLVIDCNRDPASPAAIPATSDGTAIPGNDSANDSADAPSRIAAIHAPYHRAIAELLDRRAGAGRDTIILALHSFTPVMDGMARPWHCGILHGGGNADFAKAMLHALESEPDIIVGDNQPYRMDATDHTIPRHAFPRGLPYAEIEVRQDLIGDLAGQQLWAGHLARAALAALQLSRSS